MEYFKGSSPLTLREPVTLICLIGHNKHGERHSVYGKKRNKLFHLGRAPKIFKLKGTKEG